ncbi:TonB-dependent receptor plug domain-containing protein [Confluentibacter sediminis]|uniref:TonB-dependent receptor plug domain-containing protein n=1 Tax=Confluentibacter sediminis TaxID=2219045 RepID=UPI000DAEF39D|nr:TonB-dependent receptor plug domain-containing protein [Confluentibacter sediminis]
MKVVSLKAQTVQKDMQPLDVILKILEARYNISFSYADSNIEDKKAWLPEDHLSLEDALSFLKTDTELDFEILDNRFVVIKKNEVETSPGTFKTQRLEEIIVTNYLTSGISKLNDGSITIKPETFGILPGLIEPDVLQTIQALPGVLSIDETVSNINVRGGTHDQNLLLWDGIKMYQSGHFFGLISAFNPYTTTSVNVSKNGTSAKYGDGVSSIIDMQLSNTLDGEFKAGAGFNLINADAFAKIPLSNKTELQLSARRSVTDLLVTPTYDQYFKRIFQDSDLSSTSNNSISKNEDFYFYDVAVKFLYDITKKDRVRFHFLNINNDLNYQEQSTVNNQSDALNSKLSQQNLAGGITYTKDWSDYLSTTSQVYVSNYDLDATNYDVTNNQRLIQENEVYDGSAKFEINYKPNSQFKMDGGYQFIEVGISNLEDVNNPVFRSYIKEVIRSHAVYGETSLLSNNAKTKLKFGTRLNYFKKFDLFLVEPRLSFSHRFLNDFRFEVLGEIKSQTTSQIIDLQNDFLGIEKRRWILSNNKDIPVIKSKQASIGLHYNKNRLLISAETFIKKVDGITSRSQGFQNQYQFIKATGNYTIKGFDFLINKQFNDIFNAWLSYSYHKNDYLFNNLNNGTPFPNNADVRHTLAISGAYTIQDFKLALGLNWHSGKPTTLPINSTNGTINYESPNSSNLDDYLRADVSATYAFNISDRSRATIGASIWNITNKKNIINTYYTSNNQDIINKVENMSLGITPNISLRVLF